MRRPTSLAFAFALLAAPLGLSGGCAEEPEPGSTQRLSGAPPVGHAPNGDYVLPADTLTDWVSYAEQLAVVTVVAEAALPSSDPVVKNRAGYIGRLVKLRVEESVWVNRGATPAAGEIEMTTWGWMRNGDKRHPFGPMFNPRLEVGGRYVVALVSYGAVWGTLTGESIFPAGADPIATADVHARGYSPVAHELAQRTLADVRALLDATPRDPDAERHWHLRPIERADAAAADRAARR